MAKSAKKGSESEKQPTTKSQWQKNAESANLIIHPLNVQPIINLLMGIQQGGFSSRGSPVKVTVTSSFHSEPLCGWQGFFY